MTVDPHTDDAATERARDTDGWPLGDPTDRLKARDLGTQAAKLAAGVSDLLNDALDALQASGVEVARLVSRVGTLEAERDEAMETLFKCAIASGTEVTRASWRACTDPLSFAFESVLELRADYNETECDERPVELSDTAVRALTEVRRALVYVSVDSWAESALRDVWDELERLLGLLNGTRGALTKRTAAAERRLADTTAERDEARREADSQMQAKLDAQVTLKAVTEALDLRFDQLGDGWRDATLVILDRIGVIVDETERLAGERDAAVGELAAAQEALREIWACSGTSTEAFQIADGALAGVPTWETP